MAKNVLPVDFQDDILSEGMNGRRKYQMITNADGTVSFVDVTEYTQVGSNFGQAQINATNAAVNESADKNKIIDDKDDLVANSQAGMIAGALAVKAIRDELNNNIFSCKISVYSVDVNNQYSGTIGYNATIDLSLQSDFPGSDKLIAAIPLGAYSDYDSNRVAIVGKIDSPNKFRLNAALAGTYNLDILYLFKL